jgi:hypothetical protein
VEYQIQIEDRGTYLHARVTGRNTREAIRGYLDELNARCASSGHTAVLIEEALEGPSLPMLEIFKIASDVYGQRRPVARSIAFVDVNPEHCRRNMKFAEDVAVNRGVNIRVFGRLEDAEKWLAEGGE